MKRELIVFALILLTLAFVACDMLSPEPYEPALIAVKMGRPAALQKASAIDKVWAMVVDYNPFLWEENEQQGDYEEGEFVEPPDWDLDRLFVSHFDTGLDQWVFSDSAGIFQHQMDRLNGWREFLGKRGITPVTEQFLTVVNDTARGTLTGVDGANWLIVGFEWEQRVSYFYDRVITAKAGSTSTLDLTGITFQGVPYRPEFDFSNQ